MVEGGVLKQAPAYERLVNPTFAQKAMQTIGK
jgi:hypothetical protein